MKQKDLSVHQAGLAPILIVVLIAVLSVGGYLIYNQLPKSTPPPSLVTRPTSSPSSSPESTSSAETANWKTYINNQLGFSIKFPENFQEYDFSGPTTNSYLEISLPNTEDPYIKKERNSVTIQFYQNAELTPQKLINLAIQQSRTPDPIFERSRYILDGREGEMLTEKRVPDLEILNLAIQTKNSVLDFSLMYKTINKEKTLKIFNQILSTFKFLP